MKFTPDERRIAERERNWRRVGAAKPTRIAPENCECCNAKAIKTLHLDHDHKTGKFRGWLCRPCNQAIGMLGDDVAGLLRAISYLTVKQ